MGGGGSYGLAVLVLICVAMVREVQGGGGGGGGAPPPRGERGGGGGGAPPPRVKGGEGGEGLAVGYYRKSCPRAESLIRNMVVDFLSLAPDFLRMHFHDCFVRGCDGSVLLDGEDVEKDAFPNRLLDKSSFEAVDRVKEEVEKMCPKVVSCADILAFMARDSVILTGGKHFDVPGGRKDGSISRKEDVIRNLPQASYDVPELTRNFAKHGLSQEEMVALSGAHSIGVAHCISFRKRLYQHSDEFAIDPTLNHEFALKLRRLCPYNDNDNTTTQALDILSSDDFNNDYYTNLKYQKGLLHSDQALYEDESTRDLVSSYASNQSFFLYDFHKALIHMGYIRVLTGEEGEVRVNCRFTNNHTSIMQKIH